MVEFSIVKSLAAVILFLGIFLDYKFNCFTGYKDMCIHTFYISWGGFGVLWLLRNLSISSKLWNLLVSNYKSVILILVIFFLLFFLISLNNGLSIFSRSTFWFNDFSYNKKFMSVCLYFLLHWFLLSSLLILLSAYTGFYLFFLVSWSGSWGHFFLIEGI